MIIGVGIDSGIFLTRSIQIKQKVEVGTWKSIELSALTTVIGFLPLTFAQHPFLFQLGITIVVGITGAFFGSVVLFPVFLRSFGKKAV